jgi:hypothetical protein
MQQFLKKLFLGESFDNTPLYPTALASHWRNLRTVWNNERHNDIGIERIFRLLLLLSLYLFPGLYIRHFFGKRGLDAKNLAVEFYVVFKMLFPFAMLKLHVFSNYVALSVVIYFLLETLCYITSLIFVSDVYPRPRSIRRSIFLLFLNYVEIVGDFAVLYAGFDLLQGKAHSLIDHVYFSLITAATVGYGDITPTTNLGKVLAGLQAVVFLTFIVLILNFFGSKVDDIGYAEKKRD